MYFMGSIYNLRIQAIKYFPESVMTQSIENIIPSEVKPLAGKIDERNDKTYHKNIPLSAIGEQKRTGPAGIDFFYFII